MLGGRERVGDHGAGLERERHAQHAVLLGDQHGPGEGPAAVERREAVEGVPVGGAGGAEDDAGEVG